MRLRLYNDAQGKLAEQTADLEAAKLKLAEEGVICKQQAEYLEGKLESCQLELHALQVYTRET